MIHHEMSYDKEQQTIQHQQLIETLTTEQKKVYDTIIASVYSELGAVFFLYGYGGTGKTYIWKTLSAALRRKGDIVLNVASSGIASLLLVGGRTAHSRFALPINIDENSQCKIEPESELAGLLKQTKLIIWDEAPMIHKHCFEALDRSLRDIMAGTDKPSNGKPFGGKVVVFGGDFRQILPVIPKGSRNEIVNASLNSSYLWKHCTVLRLTINMRLKGDGSEQQKAEIKEFGDWILDIGEGKVGGDNDGEAIINIPSDLLIAESTDPIDTLTKFVYPEMLTHLGDATYFQQRGILAPTHEVVDIINDHMLSQIEGDETVYLSSDSICESESQSAVIKAFYSPEVLNTMRFSGLPNHRFKLKKGVPVMLLRNQNQQNGLCNGTRLRVLKLTSRLIEAEVISGSNVGKRTLIARVVLTPSDKNVPIKINRRQFPLALCFAMTINKSQGQSLSKVGIYLPRRVFTHGQLYVALSRVTTKDGLKILVINKDGEIDYTTMNVVYKEVLQNL